MNAAARVNTHGAAFDEGKEGKRSGGVHEESGGRGEAVVMRSR